MPCVPAVVSLTMNCFPACQPPQYFGTSQTCTVQYVFPNFQDIEVGLSQPVSVFPLPEATQGAQNAIIVKVEGNSQTIRLTWTIKDEARYTAGGCRLPCCETDVANGTVIDGCGQTNVSTQFEQLEFWTTTFENRSIDQTFNFKICTGVPAEAYCKVVLLRDFKATISGAAPVTWNASVDMIVGDTVTTVDEI